MLIPTADGFLNTDHIVRAKPLFDQRNRCEITFADGAEQVVDVSPEQLERSCGTIVPARPGFVLIKALLPAPDEEGVIYSEEPVIAFRITGAEDAMPITVSGEVTAVVGKPLWCVLQPNGRCFGPDITDEDEAAFRKFCEREAAQGQEAGQ